MGCKSDEGPGAGSKPTDTCGGGGASHAGNGAFASQKSDRSKACRNLTNSYGNHND